MEFNVEAVEDLREAIDDEIAFSDSIHLHQFVPNLREDISQSPMKYNDDAVYDANMLSSTTPEAVAIYAGLWTQGRGEGMYLDPFVRGAASLGFLVPEEDRESYRNFIERTLDLIENEFGFYPNLREVYGLMYTGVALEILGNGESINRESLLAYNYGIWWGLSNIAGVPNDVVDSIHDTMLERGRLAYMEGM